MEKPLIRPATREDLEAFSDMANKPTVVAWLAELDEISAEGTGVRSIIAVWGLSYRDGRWVAFFDITPEARKYRVTRVKMGIRLFEEAKNRGIRFIYVRPDPDEPMAIKWLTSLGFKPDHRDDSFLRWSA